MRDFSIRVGSTSNIDDHSICGTHKGEVAIPGSATIQCREKTRFMSMKIEHNADFRDAFQLCEFVATGYKVTGMFNM